MPKEPIVRTPKRATPVTMWLLMSTLEEVAYVEGAAMARIAQNLGVTLAEAYEFYAKQAREREDHASHN